MRSLRRWRNSNARKKGGCLAAYSWWFSDYLTRRDSTFQLLVGRKYRPRVSRPHHLNIPRQPHASANLVSPHHDYHKPDGAAFLSHLIKLQLSSRSLNTNIAFSSVSCTPFACSTRQTRLSQTRSRQLVYLGLQQRMSCSVNSRIGRILGPIRG